jgi:CubicO group peptidase (beta-lactamase class C family)
LRLRCDAVSELSVVALVVTALTLAACTTSTVKPIGVVTGVAYACQGLALPPGDVLHVKVGLYSGPRLVTSETVRSGAKYRFSVSPGVYRLTGWWGSKGVIVRAGNTAFANFSNACPYQ